MQVRFRLLVLWSSLFEARFVELHHGLPTVRMNPHRAN